MFVTRVSRGRKIKEVIWGLILGSTVGCWFFFGVMESYAIHQFINGVINVPQVLETLGGETAVQQVLMSLPAGNCSSPHTRRDDYFPCLAYGCGGLHHGCDQYA